MMTEPGAVTSTVDRVRAMLRSDLKLGDDVALEADDPLFGGELDLDSLDVLLLVSSIEKEFGIRIPNEDVGREVFQSVRTLAAYLDAHNTGAEAGGEGAAAATAAVDGAALLAQLPHGEGFRFVDAIEAIEIGRWGRGVWRLKGDEAFFAGHFPAKPIVPGVLIGEALAQLSGVVGTRTVDEAGHASEWRSGQLAHVDIRYRRAVEPAVEIVLESQLEQVMGTLQQFSVRAMVGEDVVAEGSVTLNRGQA